MRVAVIGSRSLQVSSLKEYLPQETTVILSGGAKGIDACAKEYAQTHGLQYEEFLPEYEKYGRAAPLRRNILIIEHADLVLAFWDGTSKGTAFVIDQCKKRNIPCQIIPSASK